MKYDKVFVTSSPSFYKNNLFNEIAKKIDIFVIYTGAAYYERNDDFYRGELKFKHLILPNHLRQKISVLRKFLNENEYDEIVFGGWDNKITWWLLFHSPKRKNSCIFESSINESVTSGMKGYVKKIFLSRIIRAYPSGILQSRLLKSLGFRGDIIEYGGCGLLRYQSQPDFEARNKVSNFLYVGRLVEVKNLQLLIHAFNKLPDFNLTIIGFGPLEEDLKKQAGNNIIFHGAVDNEKLPRYYKQADVFILPSKSETWGLVVEEALNNGTPVIVSSAVGCREDLVDHSTGLVFETDNEESLISAIKHISDVRYYNVLRKGVSHLDFRKRAKKQVNTFLKKW